VTQDGQPGAYDACLAAWKALDELLLQVQGSEVRNQVSVKFAAAEPPVTGLIPDS
jgi:hypothetical protein